MGERRCRSLTLSFHNLIIGPQPCLPKVLLEIVSTLLQHPTQAHLPQQITTIFVWLSGERYPCKSPLYFRISSHLLPLPPSSDKGPPFTFSSPRSIPLLMTSHHSLSIFSRNFMNFCFSLVFIFSLFLASDTFPCYPKTCEEKGDCWLLWARKGE